MKGVAVQGFGEKTRWQSLPLADEAAPCSQVFVYYRALAKPIAKRLFSPHGGGNPSDGAQFISAVCWKPQAQTLLAANSQGCIKVMQLTS